METSRDVGYLAKPTDRPAIFADRTSKLSGGLTQIEARPTINEAYDTTTVKMPKEVKQKSGIVLGINAGHVRAPFLCCSSLEGTPAGDIEEISY